MNQESMGDFYSLLHAARDRLTPGGIMMSRGDVRVYPVLDGMGPTLPNTGIIPAHVSGGMTIREHFAGLAMQGLVAQSYNAQEASRMAVAFADALIAEIAKERK